MYLISKISSTALIAVFLIFSPTFMGVAEATGGTLWGLIPLPKNMQGKVQNNVYFAKDGSFSVKIPHKASTSEYTYMEIHERYNQDETYVSFGPAAFDRTIYRINVNPKLTPYSRSLDLNSLKDAIFDHYAKVLNATYKCQLKVVSKSIVNLNRYKAHLCEFIEHRPSTMTLEGMTQPENVHHVVYIIENNNYLGVISYAKPSGNSQGFSNFGEEFIQSFTLSN